MWFSRTVTLINLELELGNLERRDQSIRCRGATISSSSLLWRVHLAGSDSELGSLGRSEWMDPRSSPPCHDGRPRISATGPHRHNGDKCSNSRVTLPWKYVCAGDSSFSVYI